MPAKPSLRVGLVHQATQADWPSIQRVAAALHTQVTRDLGPIWGIDATVEAVQDPTAIPDGMLPILVQDQTPHSVGGLHTVDGGRPFAVVLVSRDWGLAASHECIEMLIDPTGSLLCEGLGVAIDNGRVVDGPHRVDYLIEACDPMEAPDHAYTIDGVTVSDFYTRAYFDDAARPGIRYSFNGSITSPRQVKQGGYLSWFDPTDRSMQQLCWFDAAPIIRTLPGRDAATQAHLSHREFIDRQTLTPRNHRARAEWAA